MTRPQHSHRALLIALALAVLFTLLPLPGYLEPLRPYWVGLVMLYWSLEVNQPISLGATFALGLALDLLTASLLGLHALSLLVLVYLVRRFRARMRFFPAWQQAIIVFALLMNDRVILLWISSLLGEPMPTWQYWLSPLVGVALWPWLYLLLDLLRIKSRGGPAK